MRNSIVIRPIIDSDIPFLLETLYLSIYVPEGQLAPDRNIVKDPHIAKYVDGWGLEGDMGYIAQDEEGNPVGSVTIRFFTEDNKGYGYVNDQTPELGMALLPGYRGQGIGTRLMRAIIDEAKLRGIDAISLSVDPRNPAIRLYKKFGFVEVGQEGTSITMLLRIFL